MIGWESTYTYRRRPRHPYIIGLVSLMLWGLLFTTAFAAYGTANIPLAPVASKLAPVSAIAPTDQVAITATIPEVLHVMLTPEEQGEGGMLTVRTNLGHLTLAYTQARQQHEVPVPRGDSTYRHVESYSLARH